MAPNLKQKEKQILKINKSGLVKVYWNG